LASLVSSVTDETKRMKESDENTSSDQSQAKILLATSKVGRRQITVLVSNNLLITTLFR
jgi:hypothetical protein